QSIVKFRAPSFGPFIFVGKVVDPDSKLKTKVGVLLNVVEGEAVWEWRFIVHPQAKPGKYAIDLGRSNFQVCREGSCAPVPVPDTEITITDATAVEVDQAYSAEVKNFPLIDPKTKGATAPPSPPIRGGAESPTIPDVAVVPPAASLEEHQANLKA